MSSKRGKRSQDVSMPSSSTPGFSRHGFTASPHSPFDISQCKDSDCENSENVLDSCSPIIPRLNIADRRISPLEVDTCQNFMHDNRSLKLIGDSSPDTSCSVDDVSSRLSSYGSFFSDHLQHSLSYAKQLESRALHLSNRLNASANLSMSPRLLFSTEKFPVKADEPRTDCRRRSTIVDEMNMQTLSAVSRQTTSSVDRILKYTEVFPDVIKCQTPNRFLLKLRPGRKNNDNLSKVFSPIFNSSCLVGTFSSLEDLSRTPLSVLYKGRHRLSGVIYCLKRSRSDFEIGRAHGNTISESFNELQSLSLLQHPNIVRYYTSWFETESIFLQLEFCLGGSLFHYLHPNRSLDTSEAVTDINESKEFSAENYVDSSANEISTHFLSESALSVLAAHVVSALHYMHTNWSMVHGDIKPSNILIQLSKPEAYLASSKEKIEQEAEEHCHTLLQTGDVCSIVFKLADFGRASKAGEDRDGENLGDGRYLPRLNDPSPPSRAAMGRDVYALGITLYHAAGGPMSPSVWERLRETDCLPDFTVLPVSLQPLVKTMLRPLAQDRPTAPELLGWPSLRPFLNIRQEDLDIGSQKMEIE